MSFVAHENSVQNQELFFLFGGEDTARVQSQSEMENSAA